MKKIFRLLLLGLLTFTVLSPSIVTVAEDQAVQEHSSSVYSKINSIAPMATPYIEEITLDNGESYELTKKCFVFPRSYPDITFTTIVFKIRSMSQKNEAFLIQPISTFPLYYGNEGYFYESEIRLLYMADSGYEPEAVEIHDGGVRITNYSSGPTQYRIGMNIVYHHDDIDFELG